MSANCSFPKWRTSHQEMLPARNCGMSATRTPHGWLSTSRGFMCQEAHCETCSDSDLEIHFSKRPKKKGRRRHGHSPNQVVPHDTSASAGTLQVPYNCLTELTTYCGAFLSHDASDVHHVHVSPLCKPEWPKPVPTAPIGTAPYPANFVEMEPSKKCWSWRGRGGQLGTLGSYSRLLVHNLG